MARERVETLHDESWRRPGDQTLGRSAKRASSPIKHPRGQAAFELNRDRDHGSLPATPSAYASSYLLAEKECEGRE